MINSILKKEGETEKAKRRTSKPSNHRPNYHEHDERHDGENKNFRK